MMTRPRQASRLILVTTSLLFATTAQTCTPEQTAAVEAHLASLEVTPSVEQMIRTEWAGTGHADRAVRVARCESKLNPHAQNRHSSAYGVFQFLNATWRSTGIAKTSDALRQVRAARILWGQRGWQPWVCTGR